MNRDRVLREEIARVHRENYSVYGVRKVWRQLGRGGFEVTRCTAERLMRETGLPGAAQGRRFKTTIPDESAARPLEQVERDFTPAGRISSMLQR